MEIDEAIDQLRRWCEASVGTPIEIAEDIVVTFESTLRYSDAAIQEIESELNCSLPESYKKFMLVVGESSLFTTPKYGGGINFYQPKEVIRSSIHIWDEEEEAGTDRFCFIGERMSMGDYIGFVVSRPGPKNFDVFCHEYPSQEYANVSDELKSWRTFDEWLIHAVTCKGKDTL